MKITADLHSHSGYAGGVGNIQLKDIAETMQYKGINVYGTGDCLLLQRSNELRKELISCDNGLYKIKDNSKANFLLQTEVILTTKGRSSYMKNKLMAHHIILFPNFESIDKMQAYMIKWKQKNTIGRPYIVTECRERLIDILYEIKNIHPLIEIIPAHIVTPDGVMGSANRLSHPEEFYGDFFKEINALETGLSADPGMLCEVEGLSHLTMVSFSDGHSSALNRIGREFTVFDVNEVSYKEIINAIRNNKILFTAEFMPEEGRYHLTGHRANKQGHKEAIYFVDNPPKDYICPICNKKMAPGVADWIKQLPKTKKRSKHNFIHLLPLIEVIAYAYGLKSIKSPKVCKTYLDILQSFETEIDLWQSSEEKIRLLLTKSISANILNAIIKVKNQDFYYDPPGFDGNYGVLKINL